VAQRSSADFFSSGVYGLVAVVQNVATSRRVCWSVAGSLLYPRWRARAEWRWSLNRHQFALSACIMAVWWLTRCPLCWHGNK